jgi:glycosyltransferase involved in cell wall biosynthesis
VALVTVYLPTRNRAHFLRPAVESALGQTHRDLELIVVDDASEDGTADLLGVLSAADSRLRVITFTRRSGPSAARNAAIREARGEFVTGLDDDDRMLPDRVTTLLAAFKPEYAFVCSAFLLRSRAGSTRVLNGKRALLRATDLLYFNCVGNQVLVPTERVRKLGSFDETMSGFEDYDLWLRLALTFGSVLRIADATYIKQDHRTGDQLTYASSFSEGAKAFRTKHAGAFTPSQWRSQLIIDRMICGRPIPFTDAVRAMAYPSSGIIARYIAARALKRVGLGL